MLKQNTNYVVRVYALILKEQKEVLLSDEYLNMTGLDKTRLQIGIHVIVYVTVMIFGTILFAKFWIETTNMGP